jgi:hypothetical protein
MSSGTRPGGLTALAVINFIFGGFGCLSAIGLLALMPLLGSVAINTANVPPEQQAQLDALREVGTSIFIAMGLLSAVSAALLIVSGIGYLKLKRVLGRMVGNAYGILGIVSTLGSTFMMPAALGGGNFGIGTIIGLCYPVITLALLNTAFKDDLVN